MFDVCVSDSNDNFVLPAIMRDQIYNKANSFDLRIFGQKCFIDDLFLDYARDVLLPNIEYNESCEPAVTNTG